MTIEDKYREAIQLYRDTSLTITEISSRCGVSRSGLSGYIRRHHRDLMFKRRGFGLTRSEADARRMHASKGQRPFTKAKYQKAVEACGDPDYLSYNVSEIARMFGLSHSGLSRQLRSHFPHILEWRETERHRLGIADNRHRGVKHSCKVLYADAVGHLRTSTDTVRQTADKFDVSYAGLREHVLFYHKDLTEGREKKRSTAKIQPKTKGALTGSGTLHLPDPAKTARYEEAVRLYRETAMTQKEITDKLGIPLQGFRNHIRIWHRELIFERRGAEAREGLSLADTKQYLKSTAAKYADAIAKLKKEGGSMAKVAKEFGFNPDVFRQYLQEHEPELKARLGMKRTEDGRRVGARSSEKYAEALELYATTPEPLKSIAARLGLNYKSLHNFIRRNHPDLIARHNALLPK